MSFERFSQVGQIFKSRASISTFGMLSFSSGARQRFQITEDKYKFAALFFDRDNRIIGIKLLENDDGNGVVNLRYRDKGLDLAVKSFLEYYNILPKETSLYEIEKDEQEDMLLIRLESAKARKKNINLMKQPMCSNKNKPAQVTLNRLSGTCPRLS